MSTTTTPPPPTPEGTGRHTGASWLARWEPEDEQFWESEGKARAWRTLIITTFCLTLSFSTWFLVSALITKLIPLGFDLDEGQIYWLAAMPGLAAGTLRLIHMFLTPMYGTRMVVSLSTASLLIPLVGWYFAVQDPTTSFATLMLLAFLAGLGGGNFSSFMPSTSMFFPKRLLGTALGIQAGIGNFGVSLVQFLTPWLLGVALIGGTSTIKLPTGDTKEIYIQSAVVFWIPLVAVGAITAGLLLKSIPVTANFREQFSIFREKHTWTMTSLYIMTFGTFAGLSAMFPVLIANQFGGFTNPPDPLDYAFYGPLIGSIMRVIGGPLSDRFGGAPLTTISGIGIIAGTVGVARYVKPESMDDFNGFFLSMMIVFFFAGLGNASTFKQMPMLFDVKKAAGVIGFTAAIAAYGPFLFNMITKKVVEATGSPAGFFYGLAVFAALNVVLNIYYFNRKNAPNPC